MEYLIQSVYSYYNFFTVNYCILQYIKSNLKCAREILEYISTVNDELFTRVYACRIMLQITEKEHFTVYRFNSENIVSIIMIYLLMADGLTVLNQNLRVMLQTS